LGKVDQDHLAQLPRFQSEASATLQCVIGLQREKHALMIVASCGAWSWIGIGPEAGLFTGWREDHEWRASTNT